MRQPLVEIEEIWAGAVSGPQRNEENDAALEAPIRRRSLFLLFWTTMLVFVLFGARLFSLTAIHQSDLFSAAEQSRERSFVLPATRGALLDRHGTVLVKNEPSFVLVFDPLYARRFTKEERFTAARRVAQATGIAQDELVLRMEPFLMHAEPRVLLSDIGRELAVTLTVQDIPPFFRVESASKRRYPKGAAYLAPVVGYVGSASDEELARQPALHPRELVGKTGVEKIYDALLRGKSGTRRVLVDARGRPQGDDALTPPEHGSNIRLTIDGDFSEVSAFALREAVRRSGATGGSVVAIDPRNGAVRTLVNDPTYDLTQMSSGMRTAVEYEQLFNDSRKPFLNRAVAGAYPSGSTIKPFIAAAALAEKIIPPGQRIDDTKGFIRVTSIYDPAVSWVFRDWKPHGFVNMVEALARSANVYFYTIGGGYERIAGVGIDRLYRYLEGFGFGQKLGIDLDGEASGHIPTPAWKEATVGEPWFIGDTYNLSIGQGYFSVTPLQLTAATAALANGGKLFRPHVMDAELDDSGNILQKNDSQLLRDLAIDPKALATVRQGMRAAVTSPSGTNRSLAELPFAVAAKTGTAQFGSDGKTHALTTVFAPYEDPTIVLTVLLEGGGQGTAANEVAKEILKWYAQNRES